MITVTRLHFVPALLTIAVLATACDANTATNSVVVEEDIISDSGATLTEWVVDEIVPVPPRKPDILAPERPSKNHIWVPGEWAREDDAWAWQEGRWREPPEKDASWLAGHWRFEADRWHWMPSHWVVSRHLHFFKTPLTAPAPLVETRPDKPSDHNHWIAGNWDWDGHWYWAPGYWTSKPHPDAEWVAGHWEDFGLNGGFRWIGGHWQLKS